MSVCQNMQGLLLAHDRVASSVALPDEDDDELESSRLQPFSSNLSLGGASDDQTSQNEDDTVKIVRIDKANDPLGATVKNEDGNVVIGRIVKGGAAEKSGELRTLFNIIIIIITTTTMYIVADFGRDNGPPFSIYGYATQMRTRTEILPQTKSTNCTKTRISENMRPGF